MSPMSLVTMTPSTLRQAAQNDGQVLPAGERRDRLSLALVLLPLMAAAACALLV